MFTGLLALLGGPTGWVATTVLPKLTLRNILRVAAAALIAFALWTVYSWILERGMAKQAAIDKPLIEAANKQRDEAVANFNRYKKRYDDFVASTNRINAELARQNQEKIAQLEEEAKKARESADRKRGGITNDVPRYIPEAVASTQLPLGFVQLYNDSLEGRSFPTVTGAGIPQGWSGDAGKASGINLREFAEIFVGNNAEAVYRGVIVKQWQDWYDYHSAAFTQAQRDAANAIPRVDGASDDKPRSTDIPVTPPRP